MRHCPRCKKESCKVIYYGLPALFCKDEKCSHLFGFWSNFTVWLPFNGVMMKYEGSYWVALWSWLFDPPEE